MPRYAEPIEELTPFARVLIDFMWNKRRPSQAPLNPPQLAVRLGVNTQNVFNWIYRGSVPPMETVLLILAKLDIPLSELYDAYKRSGITVPRWDASDPTKPVISAKTKKGHPKPTKVPIEATEATETSAQERQERITADAPEPRPYQPPTPPTSTDAPADEWARMAVQTAQTLRDEGVSEEAIAAALTHISKQQHGATETIEHHVIAERTEEQHERDQASAPEQKPADTSAKAARHPRQ